MCRLSDVNVDDFCTWSLETITHTNTATVTYHNIYMINYRITYTKLAFVCYRDCAKYHDCRRPCSRFFSLHPYGHALLFLMAHRLPGYFAKTVFYVTLCLISIYVHIGIKFCINWSYILIILKISYRLIVMNDVLHIYFLVWSEMDSSFTLYFMGSYFGRLSFKGVHMNKYKYY